MGKVGKTAINQAKPKGRVERLRKPYRRKYDHMTGKPDDWKGQPAKTSINVDALLAATAAQMRTIALEEPWSGPAADSALHAFVKQLSEALLTEEQQAQVQEILELWKAC